MNVYVQSIPPHPWTPRHYIPCIFILIVILAGMDTQTVESMGIQSCPQIRGHPDTMYPAMVYSHPGWHGHPDR